MILSRVKCLSRAFGSKSLTWAPIRIFRSPRSKPSSGVMPSCERLHAAQKSGTVVPIGVTTPIPVTTTRCGTPAPCIWTLSPGAALLEDYGKRRSRFGRRGARAGYEGAHPIHHRAHGLEIGRFLVGIVGDLNAEGVLDVENDHRQIERLDL